MSIQPPSGGADHEQAWIGALQAWSAGNLALAFHYCQAALVRGRSTPEVYALLGAIALGLGQYGQAKRYVELAQAGTSPPDPARRRYLAIHPWGCGLWGEIDHVIAQLAVAEITGRVPIVHWGNNGVYPAPGLNNAWEAYFEPVSDVSLGDVKATARSYFPPWWNRDTIATTSVEARDPNRRRISSLYFFHAAEDVVVADCHNRLMDILPWAPESHWLAAVSPHAAYETLFAKYIRLAPRLGRRVDEIVAQLGAGPILAVHYRAQSPGKLLETTQNRGLEPLDYFPAVDAFLSYSPTGKVFLLTDLTRCVEEFAARYGDRLRTLPAHRLVDAREADIGFRPGIDLKAVADEVIVDAYVALRCDEFIGDGASGVSCSIGYMKKWPNGAFRLMRESIILEPGRIQLF
ncbi:MAG: hypothetical protein FJX60_04040 [Alphaproteobacteria bacterium]|nr:hypothetical protein [Alphaproteobacteria bacterium]